MRWYKLGAGMLASLLTIALTVLLMAAMGDAGVTLIHMFLMLMVNVVLYDVILAFFTWVRELRTKARGFKSGQGIL